MYKILPVLFIYYIIISINAQNEGKEHVQQSNSAQHPNAHPTNNAQQNTPPLQINNVPPEVNQKKSNTQEIAQGMSSNNNKTQQGNVISTEDNTDKEKPKVDNESKKEEFNLTYEMEKAFLELQKTWNSAFGDSTNTTNDTVTNQTSSPINSTKPI